MHKQLFSWANGITSLRILMVPGIIYTLAIGAWLEALFLLIAAAATDCADGFIARTFQQESLVGTYLDPLADKLLLLSCYITLWHHFGPLTGVPFWFIVIVILREFALISLSCYLLYKTDTMPTPMQPTWAGKCATVLHFILLGIICYKMLQSGNAQGSVTSVLVGSTTILMAISGWQYAHAKKLELAAFLVCAILYYVLQ